MKGYRTRFSRLAVFIAALFAAPALPVSGASKPAGAGKTTRVVLLSTADLHGAVDLRSSGGQGGLAAVAELVASIRKREEAAGAKVLFLDAGDWYAGTPEGNATKGRLPVDAMAASGFDAIAVGNHDFDDGVANLRALVRALGVPVLSANLVTPDGSRPDFVRASWLPEDLPIEVVGLITPELRSVVRAEQLGGYDGTDPFAALAALPRVRGRARIALTHLGEDLEREIAARGLADAVLGGHTHRRIATMVNGRPFVQAGTRATTVGRIDLVVDATGRVLEAKPSLVDVDPKAGESEAVLRIVRDGAPESLDLLDEVVADLPKRLLRYPDRDAPGEIPLARLVCEAFRAGSGAEIAIMNRGGVRTDLDAGPLTRREIATMLPFTDSVQVVRVSGRSLLAAIRAMVSGRASGIDAGGLELAVDGQRLVAVRTPDGRPLDPDCRYLVATTEFLLEPERKAFEPAEIRERHGTRRTAADLFESWIRELAPPEALRGGS